ncbi:MAG: T9SS type A sorting domain-containing protein [Sphingobacteriales bacterium]|nr:T9SS type A sorting domain-containing protein [Sphingobacteriales bacterium]
MMVVNANIPLTQIRIYDLKGRMYLNQPVDNEPQSEINTSTLPEGMYFIETRAINGTVEVKKLVVSH